ncbi:MAG: arsenic resistance protein [Hyphomicrobium sp. 32-62-53]|nr:MAG: arsenic resistance protein [Hyphomicrobium sp. 12-62-95]OYX98104.1 MAG: arsenic resistance protein [Hyphomicrobium sp. 32-62-53]
MTASVRETLETRQVAIYFAAILFAVGATQVFPTTGLALLIEPALGLMLFVTFLQVPLVDLGKAFLRTRFLGALMAANFVAIPLLVIGLVQFVPADPMVRLGVLMVLLTPCIDYVVTFSHIGRADARSLLASTPILLLLQMLFLPVYLRLFLGEEAARLMQIGPFLHAFLWLIAVPLTLAAAVQFGAWRSQLFSHMKTGLDHLPVPSTTFVLFLVFAAVVPQMGLALPSATSVIPVYIAFAFFAPAIGWGVGRAAGLPVKDVRAIAFSAATRNSLVVLPLALAVPGAMPLLPAVIVAQTVVELVASLVYMKLIPKLGSAEIAASPLN